MKALVFGSTGLVGSGLMRLLVQSPQYTEIVSFVRRKSDIVPNKVKEIQSDLKNLSSFRSEFDCETVFVTLGTTIKKAGSQEKFREVDYTFPLSIAELAKESGVRSFLMVSSIGADPNSSVFYSKVKGEVERDTISLNLPSLYIFRPSLLLGHRSEFRLGEKIGEIRHWRGPGHFRISSATSYHRIELMPGVECWTLFMPGPKQRDWGFLVRNQWIQWEQYLAQRAVNKTS